MEWKSPNYRNGSFQNLHPTEIMAKDASYFTVLRGFFSKPKSVAPPRPMPSVKTDLHNLPATGTQLVWFGHSSYLLRNNGLNILVDPVFSGHASPFSFMIKAFPGSNNYTAGDMPPIDVLIVTHNHYDHLDTITLRRLSSKVKAVYTPLGVGRDLVRCGISASQITEMDWWDAAAPAPGYTLTATPARHFSGRGLKRGGSLWASFVLKTPDRNIYIGGDSGYDTHFTDIGKKFGPFDLALLESGQYNPFWPNIHMNPSEAVQAAADLHAAVLVPVHWGKFALAYHPWDEPPAIVTAAAAQQQVTAVLPQIGELVELGRPYPTARWWEEM